MLERSGLRSEKKTGRERKTGIVRFGVGLDLKIVRPSGGRKERKGRKEGRKEGWEDAGSSWEE